LAAQQTTGYCPQFDALFNELTPSEHLLLYARLVVDLTLKLDWRSTTQA